MYFYLISFIVVASNMPTALRINTSSKFDMDCRFFCPFQTYGGYVTIGVGIRYNVNLIYRKQTFMSPRQGP